MERLSNVIFNVIAFLVWILSMALIFMGYRTLSTGSSSHFTGGSGTFMSIIFLIGGSLLGLVDVFLIFFVSLPLLKERLLEPLRDTSSKARNKASERLEQFDESQQGYEERRYTRSSKPRLKMIGTRLTFLAAILALLFGVTIFLVVTSLPHTNASAREFISFIIAGVLFVIIGLLLFIMRVLFQKL